MQNCRNRQIYKNTTWWTRLHIKRLLLTVGTLFLFAYGDPNLQDLVTGVENADTVSAYINIETPTGTIALKKTSEDGVVEGISFTIKGDNFNKTVKTGKDGSVSVEGLFPGTYTVTEQSIDRYEPQKTQTVTLIGGKT